MEKKINPIIVQNKIKKAGLKLFSVLDYQRILGINNYGSARSSISRYLKLGIIQKARKGLYFLDDNPPSEFEIANKLYQPSYISFETALSFYGIIPETIFEITSATPKTTRNFTVNSLKFSYKKIKKDCFVGYQPKKIQNVIILMAEPEKALADLLYFIALGKRSFSYERINLQKIKKQKLMNYAKAFNNKKLFELIKNLYD
jgi:predicted transcriptional regulator of viral defense system